MEPLIILSKRRSKRITVIILLKMCLKFCKSPKQSFPKTQFCCQNKCCHPLLNSIKSCCKKIVDLLKCCQSKICNSKKTEDSTIKKECLKCFKIFKKASPSNDDNDLSASKETTGGCFNVMQLFDNVRTLFDEDKVEDENRKFNFKFCFNLTF